MRQQNHQKSRGRGRGRKPQNPMSRNFESNGPDVKIRGNASHIAEKYSTLARDALSNGDRVIAENYLQHAEHYNRIVAAAQAQQAEKRAERQENENDSDNDDQSNDQNNESSSDNNNVQAKSNGKGNGKSKRTKSRDASDEQGNNNSDDSGAEDEKPKRKTTRARKSNGSDEANGAGTEVSTDNEATPEGISDDALKLPDSITGGLVAEAD